MRVLIYNGQNDIIVNTAGVLNYLNTLDWHGLRAWSRTEKQQWILNGKNVGWYKNYDNLAFVLLKNAGHLVPADQPGPAINMINRFISGLW
jgi:carboxypeptidase C (cathepsin A)